MLSFAKPSLQPFEGVIQTQNEGDEIHFRMLPKREAPLPQRSRGGGGMHSG